MFGGRAQQSGYFCRYEDRSTSENENAGDMKKLLQFITIWKQFLKLRHLSLDLGTAFRVELERVRNQN